MLYVGTRVYLPPSLRRKAFDLVHGKNHSGIQSSIQRMRLSAWWPGLSRNIESMVKSCNTCSKLRPTLNKTCNTWPKADPFERIHMDWTYIKDVGDVLIIVDAVTGWIEAFKTCDKSTNSVIKCLRCVFCRFGVPKLVVSDNACEFKSNELNDWLYNQGAKKAESPPYYPQANGAAERAVQTVKKALQAWTKINVHIDFNSFLQNVLLHHRVSTSSRGISPSEMTFGRKLRLPIVNNYQQGDKVWYKPHLKEEPENATYVMSKGTNTAWILNGPNCERLTLASRNQLSERTIKEENNFDNDIIEGTEDTSEYFPNNDRSLIEDNQETPGEDTTELRRSDRRIQKPSRFGFDE